MKNDSESPANDEKSIFTQGRRVGYINSREVESWGAPSQKLGDGQHRQSRRFLRSSNRSLREQWARAYLWITTDDSLSKRKERCMHDLMMPLSQRLVGASSAVGLVLRVEWKVPGTRDERLVQRHMMQGNEKRDSRRNRVRIWGQPKEREVRLT